MIDFLNLTEDQTITDLQRENEMNKHIGRFVEWEGYIRSVSSGTSNDDTKYLLVIITNLENSYEAAFCFFGKRYGSDLMSLKNEQRVIVSGTLEYDGYNPKLMNCDLVKIFAKENE